MTTKEEVLKLNTLQLAEKAGFCIEIESRFNAKIWALNTCRFDGSCNADVTAEITNIIQLAKQSEQERIIKLLESCDAHLQAINPILHEAIRNREIKS